MNFVEKMKLKKIEEEKIKLQIQAEAKAAEEAELKAKKDAMNALKNNNKPGVKLPASLGEGSTAISILESVIIQTGTYASSRMGRLSVFWGDQVFIPSAPCVYVPKHHVDILCTLNKMPSAEEWVKKGLDKYGLIACGSAKAGMPGESAHVETVAHATALRLLAALGEVNAVGASLGSFSVSATMLNVLMDEFKSELAAKKG